MLSLLDFSGSAITKMNRAIKQMNEMISDIDFNSLDKDISMFEEKMSKRLKLLKSRFKDLDDRFIVKVPFNKETEKLTFSINGRTLTVNTEKKEQSSESMSQSTTTVQLPNDVDGHNMIKKYNEKKNIMTFIFFRNKE